jgi:hypothetical protein
MKAVVQWVLKTMMKDQTGIVRTMPKKDLVDFNVAMTAERLMRNGIDPNALKNANQVENAINQIEAPRNVQQGIKSTKSAKIMDMEGKEIPPGAKIMGGKQAETEAEILARIKSENKEAAESLKQKMKKEQARTERISGNLRADNMNRYEIGKPKLDEDEYNYYREILDDEENFVVKGDETFEQLEAMVKETEDEVAYMKRLYDKGALDPKPGERGRKKFLDRKAQKGDTMTPEEIEELKKLSEDPEDMAQGGRAGFKLGSIDKARRAFLKAAAGVGGGIAALKTGLLSIGKGADAVKNIPPIKTPVTKLEGTTTQMPDWFPSFINKFRDEGKAKDVFKTKKVEVSKEEFDQAFKEGKGENYYTDVARTPEYKANNPDHMDYYKRVDTDERIYTTYTNDKVPGVRVDDMDGNVDVMFENDYSQPVSMNYTAPGKRGPETGRADVFVQGEAKLEPKPKGEFVANDVEVYATDPDGGSESVDVIADTVDDMLEGKTRQMEEYVTGKKTKLSKGEGRVIEAEVRAEQAAERAAEDADFAGDTIDLIDDRDYSDVDFASGGIARMLGE